MLLLFNNKILIYFLNWTIYYFIYSSRNLFSSIEREELVVNIRVWSDTVHMENNIKINMLILKHCKY